LTFGEPVGFSETTVFNEVIWLQQRMSRWYCVRSAVIVIGRLKNSSLNKNLRTW